MKKILLMLVTLCVAFNASACSGDGSSRKSDKSSESAKKKCLVVYFTCTNTTKGVAEQIASATNGDLFRIQPQQPYTDEDLDYNNNSSRSTVEQNDKKSRPALSEKVKNWNEYSVVFIGYPIWWGIAPRAVYTFIESYDFTGKTVVPFCTSGGSGIGASDKELKELCSKKSEWKAGKKFQGKVSQNVINKWIKELFPNGI